MAARRQTIRDEDDNIVKLWCSGCKDLVDVSLFGNSPKSWCGYKSYCTPCLTRLATAARRRRQFPDGWPFSCDIMQCRSVHRRCLACESPVHSASGERRWYCDDCAVRICATPSCYSVRQTQDLCASCYNQKQKGRTPTPSQRLLSPLERILSVIDVAHVGEVETACWIYPCTGPDGWAVINWSGVDRLSPHAFMWEHFHGKLAPGEEMHHLCRTRACCNPDHLIPLSSIEHQFESRVTKSVRLRNAFLEAENERLRSLLGAVA